MNLLALFKRAKNALPPEVTAAIDAAAILPREPDEHGPRTAVALGGGGFKGAFVFTQEEAARRILKRWPDLTEPQVSRAVSYLSSRVKLHAEPLQPAGRVPWIHRY